LFASESSATREQIFYRRRRVFFFFFFFFFLFIVDDARRRQREEKRTKSETPTVLRRPHCVQQFDVFALERRFQARAEIPEVEN
jgi:hypothetical protein